MFNMALALRFPAGEITVPSLAVRDKQEADENNSAGSWAVSGRVEKTELPSTARSLLQLTCRSCPSSLLSPCVQTSACLSFTSVQHADLTLFHLCSDTFYGSPAPSG